MANNYCSNCGEPSGSQYETVCTNCGKPYRLSQTESERENAHSAEKIVYVTEKSTAVAILLSFLFTGAGQVYNGQLKKGLLMMVGLWAGAILIFPIFLIWIYSMYDAYKEADKMNKGEIPFAEATAKDAIIYIAAYFIIGFIFVLVLTFLMFLFMIPFMRIGY